MDITSYQILLNEEGQYAIWPVLRTVPDGWKQVGPVGERQACLDWIEAAWTDIRPRSLIAATGTRG